MRQLLRLHTLECQTRAPGRRVFVPFTLHVSPDAVSSKIGNLMRYELRQFASSAYFVDAPASGERWNVSAHERASTGTARLNCTTQSWKIGGELKNTRTARHPWEGGAWVIVKTTRVSQSFVRGV